MVSKRVPGNSPPPVPPSFARETAILGATGFACRVIGALSRVPLVRLLGAEGIGLYQMAYSVYGLSLILAVSGFPTAVSKLVAESLQRGDSAGARRFLGVSTAILLFTGAVFSAALLLGAPFVAERLLGDPRSLVPIRALAPALVLVCLMGALRGYFQGHRVMVPTALSQMVEQVVRVGAMLSLSYLAAPYGVEYAAGGAALAASFGAAAGLALLVVAYWHQGHQDGALPGGKTFAGRGRGRGSSGRWKGWKGWQGRWRQERRLACKVAHIALPITLGALALPLMDSLDAVLVPNRLRSLGLSMEAATQGYGRLSGIAGTLATLPTIVTTAISASIVPWMAAAKAGGEKAAIRDRTSQVLKLTMLVAFPAAAALGVFSVEVTQILFGDPEAGRLLAFLVPASVFMALEETTSGILRGLGRTGVPVMNMLAGALVKGVATFVLAGIPGVGVTGAALGTVAGFGAAASLNLLAVSRVAGCALNVGSLFAKPLLATLTAMFLLRAWWDFLVGQGTPVSLSVLGVILPGPALYVALLLLMRTMTAGEWSRILSLIPLSRGARR